MFFGLLIMTLFFAGFVHTDKGATCNACFGSGCRDLFNAQECSDAENFAKSFNSRAGWDGELWLVDYPRGCFVLDSGDMYFNTHTTGGFSSAATSICRKSNT